MPGDLYYETDSDLVGRTVKLKQDDEDVQGEIKFVGRDVQGRRKAVIVPEDADVDIDIADVYFLEEE